MAEPSKRKFKGQAHRTALQLFGLTGQKVMESKEDREHMALVLRMSHDARMKALAAQALDPLHVHTSFAKLAENLGLNYHMISTEYRELKRSEGFIRAASHLPDLMEQAAIDSRSEWQDCRNCKGIGKVDAVVPCAPCEGAKGNADCEKCHGKGKYGEVVDCGVCQGKGLVYVLGDIDRLKLIFDTFGLTGKGGGVNVNLDLRKTDVPESLGDLAESLGPILEGGTK